MFVIVLFIYSCISYLLVPVLMLLLKIKSFKNKEYLDFWYERFVCNSEPINTPVIWIHAVSVGEVRAVAKIIELLQAEYNQYKILITVMTPTGRETAFKIYDNVIIRYVPYDIPFAVKNFYKTFTPKICLIVETEIWPNLIFYGKKHKCKMFLINARLSDISLIKYKYIKFFIKPLLNQLEQIICSSQKSMSNFSQLTDTSITTTNNIKFDITYTQPKQILFFNRDRRVIVFASSRNNEEKLLLEHIDTDCLLIIVPRHKERFAEVESLLISRRVKYQKRSDNHSIDDDTKVVIGDSMGEMMSYYMISDIAIMGGSLLDTGGQNPLEAFASNIPVIMGQYMNNFEEIAKNAVNFCALQTDIANINNTIKALLNTSKYNKMKSNCKTFVQKYSGGSKSVFDILQRNI